MNQIGEALRAVGWKWNDWDGPHGSSIVRQPGLPSAGVAPYSVIKVQIDIKKRKEWEPVILFLGETLTSIGIEAEASMVTDGTMLHNAIHILIGRKP